MAYLLIRTRRRVAKESVRRRKSVRRSKDPNKCIWAAVTIGRDVYFYEFYPERGEDDTGEMNSFMLKTEQTLHIRNDEVTIVGILREIAKKARVRCCTEGQIDR